MHDYLFSKPVQLLHGFILLEPSTSQKQMPSLHALRDGNQKILLHELPASQQDPTV